MRTPATPRRLVFVVKPVEASRLLPAFEAALACADEIGQLRRTEANLNGALAAGRDTSLGKLRTRSTSAWYHGKPFIKQRKTT